ncbi:DUF4846 domain-containing protein [Haliscomenobacter sp.]|uniref:DUF4846 domain-containing protein n=1 Tax=Haliscomenobacter sp. TaxID=2717303 RepID=UPI0035943FC3
MYKKQYLIFLCCLSALNFAACQKVSPFIQAEGTSVETRIKPPSGFERTAAPLGSFAAYLRKIPLKPASAGVFFYNGLPKLNQVHVAVMDIDVGTRDLQQCADAVMRLRAEYLFAQKRYTEIHFNFTNGFNCTYPKWREGYRVKVSGNQVSWYKKGAVDGTYKTFRSYLDMVYSYAGTLSLEKELKPTKYSEMNIGDVLIRGGSPGHAVIVVDMAQNPKTGEKLFLLAQSYMPAQDIHILQNPNDPKLSPWYSANTTGEAVLTPEWGFVKGNLRRF